MKCEIYEAGLTRKIGKYHSCERIDPCPYDNKTQTNICQVDGIVNENGKISHEEIDKIRKATLAEVEKTNLLENQL
ncbi:MAG TPA: hypothetical protein ENG87_01220 [Candidatus Pacearchaeota archaeon]|nr:hypothetical protein BMS3Abin17_00452 [archaeon BMS3Abin17]HDK41971.1 hypothetical protein [Candidatus Pacearchaeota archaeon]HDZ61130.1 hypothetical protein [Candidatus Pacearchaeota archaeon]